MSTPTSTNINPRTGQPFSSTYVFARNLAQFLPVTQQMPGLIDAIRNNDVTVIMGETGSGKSTQIPQRILEELADWLGKDLWICLTQPRRLATQSIGTRLAVEQDVKLGELVGCAYRGVNLTDEKLTRLVVSTDGTTIAIAKTDRKLEKFGVIIIDEAHQHSIPTDLLLGLLKSLLTTRRNLKVVIMSATMDANLFTNYFPGSVLKEVSGRQFDVAVRYLAAPPVKLAEEIVNTILYVHHTQQSGNILVFVAGVREIYEVENGLINAMDPVRGRFSPGDMGPLAIFGLHAKMSTEDQDSAIFALPPKSTHGNLGRKVIISTNIAETSITIEGVTHVVDSCKAKSMVWDPRTETWTLQEFPTSKADSRQRKGRAGRTRDGMAWLMCTERGFNEDLTEFSVPPILHCDMLNECLHILKMGQNPADFDYIKKPAAETIVKALGLLRLLGAVDMKGGLTRLGEQITAIPTDVYTALTLIRSTKFGCSDEVISILSMIEATEGGSNLFLTARTVEERKELNKCKKYFRHSSGDHLTLFNIYMAWRVASHNNNKNTITAFLDRYMLRGTALRAVDRTRTQFLSVMSRQDQWTLSDLKMTSPLYYSRILQALAAGNYLRVAKRKSPENPKQYDLVRSGLPIQLPDNLVLGEPSQLNEWVFYNECFMHPEKGRSIRVVSAITPELMVNAEPGYWWNAEFLPEGHIKEGLLGVIARLGGPPKDDMRGGMPSPAVPA